MNMSDIALAPRATSRLRDAAFLIAALAALLAASALAIGTRYKTMNIGETHIGLVLDQWTGTVCSARPGGQCFELGRPAGGKP